ncbi:PH domain-containing protein [uncultured Flavobacterium sp.]|uniref:PH domain-containing protein n=1 Tax=uncultured Flavobacterium sp. TaxID=165435 RepID=UPI0030EC20DB|tara:strand:+ start:3866 stop:4255 length:390 start_codon:yes stop_codon:yes gene_type:complete
MKTFKSKIDWWLVGIIIIVFAYPIIDGILSKQYALSYTMLAILGLIGIMFSKIKYVIVGKILKIWWIKVEIQTIRKIYKTRNPLSSPALSLDRIAIVYNKYDEVLISPKNKKEFIDELLKINPDIVVEI